jgi:hypothetical protein
LVQKNLGENYKFSGDFRTAELSYEKAADAYLEALKIYEEIVGVIPLCMMSFARFFNKKKVCFAKRLFAHRKFFFCCQNAKLFFKKSCHFEGIMMFF